MIEMRVVPHSELSATPEWIDFSDTDINVSVLVSTGIDNVTVDLLMNSQVNQRQMNKMTLCADFVAEMVRPSNHTSALYDGLCNATSVDFDAFRELLRSSVLLNGDADDIASAFSLFEQLPPDVQRSFDDFVRIARIVQHSNFDELIDFMPKINEFLFGDNQPAIVVDQFVSLL